MGLSSTQCSNSIVSLSTMTCWIGRTCGYSYVRSLTSMTVEKCIQICIENEYAYAGLGL